MKSFVSTVRVYRTSTVLSELLCCAVALLVACGVRATPSTTPPINSVDLAVTGQTVTKARTAGNEAMAIASLRAIHSAEVTYSLNCAQGGYAVSLEDLGKFV